MSNSGNSEKWDAIRELPASSITGVYQPLGSVLLRDAFEYWLTNNTNGDIYLSKDGVTDQKKLPALSGRASDKKTNDMFMISGTQIYIRFAAVPASPLGWFGFEVEYV